MCSIALLACAAAACRVAAECAALRSWHRAEVHAQAVYPWAQWMRLLHWVSHWPLPRCQTCKMDKKHHHR